MSTETIRLIGGGGGGGGGEKGAWRSGKREIIYLLLLCHHQNFCVKVGSDESILMSHNCEGQSHKTVSTDHKF